MDTTKTWVAHVRSRLAVVARAFIKLEILDRLTRGRSNRGTRR